MVEVLKSDEGRALEEILPDLNGINEDSDENEGIQLKVDGVKKSLEEALLEYEAKPSTETREALETVYEEKQKQDLEEAQKEVA